MKVHGTNMEIHGAEKRIADLEAALADSEATARVLADGLAMWLKQYNKVKSEHTLGVIEMSADELIQDAVEQVATAKAKEDNTDER